MNEKTLAERISFLRREAGMTQEQLAQRLGVTYQAVSKWENAQSCPDVTLLPELADVFGVTIDSLFGREEVRAEPAPAAPETGGALPWPDDDALYCVLFQGHRLLTPEPAAYKGERLDLCLNWNGPAKDIFSAFDILCEETEILGSVHARGDVSCGDVAGNVNAWNDVSCGEIGGSVIAGGDVTCDTVEGDVKAGDDVNCDNVEGNVNAGGDVTCDTVEGDVRAGGSVTSETVEGSVYCGGADAAIDSGEEPGARANVSWDFQFDSEEFGESMRGFTEHLKQVAGDLRDSLKRKDPND